MESSAPAKPQPLHNFDLPNLKWKTNENPSSSTTSHHQHRRRSITPQSPPLDSVKATPKILIKIPGLNNNIKREGGEKNESPPPKICLQNNGEHSGLTTDEINDSIVDEELKIWNLRPRKPKHKSSNFAINAEKNTNNKPVGEMEKKKEKKKLSISISLSKQEIEEDMYSFTGSKPSRRPKKRAKIVQKKMDTLFPGLWLVSISPDSYKVSENSMKG